MEVDDGAHIRVQFFLSGDLADPTARLVRRICPANGGTEGVLLQTHGWVDGFVTRSMEDIEAKFDATDKFSWPMVAPVPGTIFVDRRNRELPVEPVQVPLDKLRLPSDAPPELSVMIARWGGKVRVGESTEEESLETDGGWGEYGAPPSDWYQAGMVNKGILVHSSVASSDGKAPEVEVLSLFLGSDADLKGIVESARSLVASLRGRKRTGFWMLWPCEFEADWRTEGFAGYVERRKLFAAMRACEAAGLRTCFPHPAALYELITSKAWMATLSSDSRSVLPAAVLIDKKTIMANPDAAAAKALAGLDDLRKGSQFGGGAGPSMINRGGGMKKGCVKIGWSWEAKFVWFWKAKKELANSMQQMLTLPGCLADPCIVQEWVDFDFELRLFFFPPAGWQPPVVLEPLHHGYTGWAKPSGDAPGAFRKITRERALELWEHDTDALAAAHVEAERASQFLIAWLLECYPEPVAMIRMDFMIKRWGPGNVQVVFGEYCETGCCVLQWPEGPANVWRSVLDYAVR